MKHGRDASVVGLLFAYWAAWYAPGWLGGLIPVWEDTAAYFFANRSILYTIAHETGFHWWDPLPMLGVPRMANIQNGTFSPISLLFYAVPTLQAFVWFPILALGLLSSFAYGLFRVCGVGRVAASFGALSWATAGNLLTHVQHTSAIDTLLWLPATLLAWECCVRCRSGPWRTVGWAVLASLGVAFQCFGALPQFVLYNGLVMGMWFGLSILRARADGRLLVVGGLAAGVAVIGAGLASWQLLPFLEMVDQSHRSLLSGLAGFGDQFRAAPHEIGLALISESYLAIDPPPLTYGAPYTLPANLSVLAIGFALFALVKRPRAGAEWICALFFLLGMLGSAGGVTQLLGWLFPFAGQLRAPIRMIVPAAFWLSWLGALGVQRWLDGGERREWLALAAVAWVAVLGWGLNRSTTEYSGRLHSAREVYAGPELFTVPPEIAEAESRIAVDFQGSQRLPLFALNAGLVAGVPTLLMREVLIPRTFFEAWFSSQYGPPDPPERMAGMRGALMLPLARPYHPMMRALGLSSVIRFEQGHYRVFNVVEAMARFSIVPEVVVASDAKERWALAASTDWDPERTAIVEEPVESLNPASVNAAWQGRLRVIRDEPDRHWLEVDSDGGIVMTSGQFFPGWEVEVDGRRAQPLRVDLALRGVEVPPGIHDVRWRYRPTWLPAAQLASGIAVLTACGLLYFVRRFDRGPA